MHFASRRPSGTTTSRARAERWGARTFKPHDRETDRWTLVKKHGARRRGRLTTEKSRYFRAEAGKLAVDHSAETTAREVYVAACEERGVVPNTRATRGLAMSSCDLAHAGLGDANVEAVGVALQSGALATSLNLRDNDASEIGFERLAHGLMDNARLVRLDCSDNPGPGARGVAALCRVLDPSARARRRRWRSCVFARAD